MLEVKAVEYDDEQKGTSKALEDGRRIIETDEGPIVESFPTDRVIVEKLLYDRTKKSLVVELAAGGLDAEGELQVNEKYKTFRYLFSQHYTRKLWESHKLDDGPPNIDTVQKMLIEEVPVFKIVASQKWAIPDVSVSIVGDEIKEPESPISGKDEGDVKISL